jgi:hypothetical protein
MTSSNTEQGYSNARCVIQILLGTTVLQKYRRNSWQNTGVMAQSQTERNFRLQNGVLYIEKALRLSVQLAKQ